MSLKPRPRATFLRLRLRGYKAWKDIDLELRPLTLVLGANSSGKSTLLEPLLAMKQTFESPDPDEHFKAAGELVDAGRFEEIVHRGATAFSIGFDRAGGGDTIETYDATYVADSEGTPVVQALSCRTAVDDSGVSSEVVRDGDRYKVMGARQATPGAAREFAPSPGRSLPPGGTWASEAGAEVVEEGDDPYVADLVSDFKRLRYLGPVRREPERRGYRPKTTARIGPRGEGAVELLLASRDAADDLLARVSQWLNKLGVADEIRAGELGARYRDVRVVQQGVEASLADVGFGVGQVLPIIVHLCAPELAGTLLVEEPESHLHPGVQGLLADLFIEATQGGSRQIIVETHSEHLLRRMQRRVAEGRIRAEDVAIYFCERDASGSRLTTLELDEQGWIRNWPRDFFGDEMADLVAMTDALANGAHDGA